MRVVGGPLVDQRALARLEHQQHPARATAQRLAHGDELLAPALDAAEAGFQPASSPAPSSRPSPPRLPKYSSCSSIELVAISSSRFRPLSWKPGRRREGRRASSARIALSRFTAPP
jgi:hypothetical protein